MSNEKQCNETNREPPNIYEDFIAHPMDKVNKSIEKILMIEHRYAFYYWYRWYEEMRRCRDGIKPPLLVTIDWHTDLTSSEGEKEYLDKIEEFDLAYFCWTKMYETNDGHILAAAYLNIIGNIVILKRQDSMNGLGGSYLDKYGNEHLITEFNNIKRFEEHLIKREEEAVFFDIDLDYFITNEGIISDGKSFDLMDDEEIKKIINIDRPFIKWILERIEGYTIAMEPTYCGGIYKSARILKIIEEQLFTPEGEWRI